MTNEDIRSAIKLAVDDLFDLKVRPDLRDLLLQPDFKFEHITDSSIVIVDICFHIEDTLGVEIELSEVLDNPTFLGFSSKLLERVAGL